METGVMGIHQEVCIWEVQGSLAAHPDTGPHGDMGKRRDAVALELAGCVADKQGSRRLPWRPQKMPFPCPELHACEHLPSLGEACSSREATGICTEHAADELYNSREERGFSAVVCWGQQDSCLSVRGLDGSALN
ncbi:uncharacterized protein LOC144331832 isoform X1 [Macaca mulatta]